MSKKVIILSATAILLAISPMVVYAVPTTLSGVADVVLGIIKNILWTISTAFVIVMFTIAGFKFLTAQGNPQQVEEARQAVIWGLAGVMVIVLAWSIIAIVSNQFGV